MERVVLSLQGRVAEEVRIVQDEDRGTWRVRVGRSQDREALRHLADRLRALGHNEVWLAREYPEAPVGANAADRLCVSDTGYFDDHPFVLHFASRGHLDVMNRIIDHQFFNSKSGDAERERLSRFLLGQADWSNIPTRCLLTQFFTFLPQVEPRISIPLIESRTDVRDLRDIFRKHIKTVIDFEDCDLDEIEDRFERCYRYARKLASLDPGEVIRLDEYLDCETQEGYIDRLRRALVNSSIPS